MKIVIRAGGVGTRLWPISRADNPKQFQKIVGDNTMVKTTFERVAPLLADTNDLFVSVNQSFRGKVKQDIPKINEKNIIIETDTRNTGPAICLEVCYLEKFCDKNEVIATLPSDDYISDNQAFRNLLVTTEKFILQNPNYILTPAVKPDYPDIGYSYLKAGKNLYAVGKESIYEVADWVEKPNIDYCQEIIKTGDYYCHTGIYLWQLSRIIQLFKKLQPTMYENCQQVVESMSKDSKKAKELYSKLKIMSIESAITNKVDKIAMSVSDRIGWSDLGKWHIIKRMLKKEKKENLIKGKVITRRAVNNLIYSMVNNKKIIVINDIKNLAIIDTDDVLFISSLEESADIKKLIEKLKEKGMEEYL